MPFKLHREMLGYFQYLKWVTSDDENMIHRCVKSSEAHVTREVLIKKSLEGNISWRTQITQQHNTWDHGNSVFQVNGYSLITRFDLLRQPIVDRVAFSASPSFPLSFVHVPPRV